MVQTKTSHLGKASYAIILLGWRYLKHCEKRCIRNYMYVMSTFLQWYPTEDVLNKPLKSTYNASQKCRIQHCTGGVGAWCKHPYAKCPNSFDHDCSFRASEIKHHFLSKFYNANDSESTLSLSWSQKVWRLFLKFRCYLLKGDI